MNFKIISVINCNALYHMERLDLLDVFLFCNSDYIVV
jgi:hypothetical protein